MSLFQELNELGVDVNEGLERVMDDEPLYETMLGMFVERVDSDPIMLEDFDAQDLDKLISQVHILKGLTGNLSMTPLFEGYMQVLDLLRTGCPQEALQGYKHILPTQLAIVECIKRYMNV